MSFELPSAARLAQAATDPDGIWTASGMPYTEAEEEKMKFLISGFNDRVNQ